MSAATGPIFVGGPRRGDVVHARCVAYAQRRLEAAGWRVAREVEVVHGRHHAWIDLLAFHPATRTLLIIECKTRVEDAGAIERQVSWYERVAMERARALGWEPVGMTTWLLVLASEDFFTGPAEAYAAVMRHLGLERWEPQTTRKSNFMPYPDMSAATRRRLVDYFRPHNAQLYELLGRRFDWDR